ncbi:MAG: hypothetical protein NZ570_07405 [Candidatus Caldarchaeum sp.]|nr:hypothetical protein [Candidatus Caldarchaeum sp.]MCS7137935.1 hypothetical protein [Candidatus Caldarchaeum sp.]MDW7978465.1 hypothetical protein [Candidatus Caldarchaeum sp.]MDW8359267.1 hypothetical protein [Candidatus Caldarchaeum sp.]
MITRAMTLILALTAAQLAQGVAMRMEMADPAMLTPVHIGLGVATALILLGLTRTVRSQKSPVAADVSFVLLLLILQGVSGIFILAEVEAAALIHLALSFFVVAATASTLVLSASS